MNWKQDLLVLAYMLLFCGSVAGMLWWQKRRRKTRLPFNEEFKLLRGPGETQLKLVQEFSEDGVFWMLAAAFVPAVVASVLLLGTARLPTQFQVGGAAVTLVASIVSFYLSARWFSGKTKEIGNRYLGYFGERVVAEHLDQLKAAGWRVFHDVPCEAGKAKFNIDHIAVGAGGVFVLETKTRRKGSARPGFDDHKVFFDGRSLVWPWGEDNHGLEQAERNAVWLADTLKSELGERFHVSPVLVLPGWWLENKPSRESRLCQVMNPKWLAERLGKQRPVLDDRQISSISAKLESRCRDVEY
ncbi:MAG TPA: nuclease-related domain-containing protein [Candidatus Didemnitutus sp.]|jgi:hypothetical protein